VQQRQIHQHQLDWNLRDKVAQVEHLFFDVLRFVNRRLDPHGFKRLSVSFFNLINPKQPVTVFIRQADHTACAEISASGVRMSAIAPSVPFL